MKIGAYMYGLAEKVAIVMNKVVFSDAPKIRFFASDDCQCAIVYLEYGRASVPCAFSKHAIYLSFCLTMHVALRIVLEAGVRPALLLAYSRSVKSGAPDWIAHHVME
jgi:hypothetical protein